MFDHFGEPQSSSSLYSFSWRNAFSDSALQKEAQYQNRKAQYLEELNRQQHEKMQELILQQQFESKEEEVKVCNNIKKCSFSSLCYSCNDFFNCFDVHCNVNGKYVVDFVLKYKKWDVFVMLDDVFWHGLALDDDIENSFISETIQVVCKRDLLFNNYCAENKIILLRFVYQFFEEYITHRADSLDPYFAIGINKKINKEIISMLEYERKEISL